MSLDRTSKFFPIQEKGWKIGAPWSPLDCEDSVSGTVYQKKGEGTKFMIKLPVYKKKNYTVEPP